MVSEQCGSLPITGWVCCKPILGVIKVLAIFASNPWASQGCEGKDTLTNLNSLDLMKGWKLYFKSNRTLFLPCFWQQILSLESFHINPFHPWGSGNYPHPHLWNISRPAYEKLGLFLDLSTSNFPVHSLVSVIVYPVIVIQCNILANRLCQP